MWKCENCLSSLAPLALIYVDFLNVSVLSVYCRLYIAHTINNKRKLIVYADVIWDLNMFLRQNIWSTNKILKEMAVLECENAKIF